MSKAETIYPYERTDAVQLYLGSFRDASTDKAIEGVQFEGQEYGAMRVFLPEAESILDTLRVDVTIVVAGETITALLHDDEVPEETISATLSLVCASTKLRQAFRLAWDEGNRHWTGTIELQRADLRGLAVLRPLLVRTTDATTEQPGRADFAGAIIGEGSSAQVIVDRSAKVYRSDFGYSWFDFAKKDHDWLKHRGSDVYYLEAGEAPHVYLNLGWPFLQPILDSADGAPEAVALRQCFGAMIRHGVWQQLLITAIASIRENEEGWTVLGEPWRADLAAQVGKALYPKDTEQGQLERLHAALTDVADVGQLLARIGSLTHDYSDAGKLLEKAMKAGQKITQANSSTF